jgi:hypothetical protein
MKKIPLLILVLVVGCGSPRPELAKIDSLALARDTVNDFSSDAQTEDVLGEPIDSFLAKALAPKDQDSDSVFTINVARVLDQNFADNFGQCVQPGVVVFVARSRHSAQQQDYFDDNGDDLFDIQYSLITVAKSDSAVVADLKLDVNKWNDPANYTAIVTDEFSLSPDCTTLAIRYDNQGGGESDLPWQRTAVTFYVFTPGGFNQVLEVLEEDSFTMRNHGGGPNHPVKTVSTIDLLTTTTNGLKDIRVTTVSGLEEGGDKTTKVATYYFNGAEYLAKEGS